MKLVGTYTFEAPRERVWEALLDPEVLVNVMPGCEHLEKLADNAYEGKMKIRVGPVQGKFKGRVTLSDLNPPEAYRIIVDGKSPSGFVKGDGQVQLEAQGHTTIMHYSGEAQVGGRLAGVSQRLLDSSAKALTKQSLDGLNKQIQARLKPQPTPATESASELQPSGSRPEVTPVSTVEAPSQAEFALGVAKNMLDDLVPSERRPTLIAAGLMVLTFFVFLNWWSNRLARQVANEIWERR